MSIIQSIALYFREGSSDKVYHVKLEDVPGGYVVNVAWGRRGTTLQTGTKTTGPVSLAIANRAYDKVVAEKTGKGYQIMRQPASPSPAVSAPVPTYTTAADVRDSGVRCQLLNPISEAEALQFIESPEWWAQEKHDGKRLTVKKTHSGVIAINRKGLTTDAPEAILTSINRVDGDCVVDGEAVGETLFAFDVIDSPFLPYSRRLALLEDLGLSGAVQVVYTARTTVEKRALYTRLRRTGAEGIVFKRHTARHTPGRPNSGGDQLKFKFYETASVIVTGHNAQRSVAMAVLDEQGAKIPVGNVTIPPNQAIPPVGAIVEVRYLYAYKGGSLYQPVYLGIRDDVEADTAQALKYTNGQADDANPVLATVSPVLSVPKRGKREW